MLQDSRTPSGMDIQLATSRLRLEDEVERLGLSLTDDDHINWNENCILHPRKWNKATLYYNIAIIIFWDFFTAATSTVGTSASAAALEEYGLSPELGFLVFTTSNILGEGFGGVVFPPITESFGRKKAYIFSTIVFCVFSGLTSIPSLPLLVIGRTMTGVVTGIPATIAPGSLEDMLDAHTRIWGIFAWTTASNTGLVLGPIFSSYITDALGWRWVFYIATIISAIFALLALNLKESRPSYILQRQLTLLRTQTGYVTIKIDSPDHFPTIFEFAREALGRPFYLLVTEPIIVLCSFLNAIAFGLIYGLTEVLVLVYTSFSFSAQASALAFIPVFLGVWLSGLSRIYDQRKISRLRAEGTPITPEAKLDSFAVAVPALAVGLWWFAWTIPPAASHIPWIVSMIGLVPVGFAANDIDAVLGGYLVDSYTAYAASAFAALSLTRSLISAAFSLCVAVMFQRLDSNVAGSVLAGMATVFCVSPIILLKFGKMLRGKSTFAKFSRGLEFEGREESTESSSGLSEAKIVVEERV